MENKPVQKVDIMRYAGKWFTLYSVPTLMDKHWRERTETYVIHPDGYFAVFTTYKSEDSGKMRYIRSKLFVVRKSGNARFKMQLVWPFKTDYWIIELPEDYSYVVIGHPERAHLSILSRRPYIDPDLFDGITERCAMKGYDISKLVDQEHRHVS